MDREKESALILMRVEACAKEDLYLKVHTWDREEFEYYSNTSKVMAELADKYSLTLEELDKLWNYYYDFQNNNLEYYLNIYKTKKK